MGHLRETKEERTYDEKQNENEGYNYDPDP